MASLLVISLFSVVFIFCSPNQVSSEIYHIKANSTSTDYCIAPCLTLSDLLFADYSQYSNTTLVFLPGIHYLIFSMSVSRAKVFSMTSKSIIAQVVCRRSSSIHFDYSQYVSISNLEFIGCGGNQIKQVKEFVVKDTRFNGQNTSGTALEIIKTATWIVNSTFKFNRKGYNVWRNSLSSHAGGAIIATDCEININHSKFINNQAKYGGAIFAQNHSIIVIHDSIFINNSAGDGVPFSWSSTIKSILYSLESTITIKLSKFDHNIATSRMGRDGVVYALRSTISIEASEFDCNTVNSTGGGSVGGVLYSSGSNITINVSKFNNNSVTSTSEGGVLYFSLEGNNITIETTTFKGNTCRIQLYLVAKAKDNLKPAKLLT